MTLIDRPQTGKKKVERGLYYLKSHLGVGGLGWKSIKAIIQTVQADLLKAE